MPVQTLSRGNAPAGRLVAALFAVTVLWTCAVAGQDYDLVIANGRVIDPETRLDALRNIGVRDGQIVRITGESLEGASTIDARGHVVAPGFIDVHSHTPTLLGQHVNLLDGITTQLELEGGAFPVGAYGDHYAGGAQLNYGASVGYSNIRMQVIEGSDMPYFFVGQTFAKLGGAAWTQQATPDQLKEIQRRLEQGLDAGGLGIGLALDYMTSAVSDQELRMIFAVAGQRKAPVTVHVRRGMPGDPAGLLEVVELAKTSGAPLFVCHITHSAMGGVDEWLAVIDEANASGARIITETLSYGAGGTSINADVFRRRDWRKIFDISYEDVQWVATGEWLTEATWNHYADTQPQGMVNHHYVKEAWIETAIRWPSMMISTDALPAFDRDVFTNPNIAGTFSRFLGHYVRERKLLPLVDALARTSLLQANWLTQVAPDFARKGRIQEGADADIVIFNPETIAAGATYGKPYRAPVGIPYVIVGGRVIVEMGERIEGRYPGKRLLGKIRESR